MDTEHICTKTRQQCDYVVEKETHNKYKIIKLVRYMQSIRLGPAKSIHYNSPLIKA